MDKLDRLGWAAGIALRAYGRRIGIRLSESRPLDRVIELLPPGWKPATSPAVDVLYSVVVGGAARGSTRRLHLVYSDESLIARTRDLGEALQQLEVDLQLEVAGGSRHRLFVHAGVVGWRGQAIVIPGRSCSGKSTLVGRLIEAGATYFSDEYALFDRRGWVFPYPVPLAVGERKGGRRQSRIHPEAMTGRIGKRPIPVGRVLVTSYSPLARWRPRRLGPGQAVLELLKHTVRARQAPAHALDILSRVVCQGEVWKGARGEASEIAPLLLAGGATPPILRSPLASPSRARES